MSATLKGSNINPTLTGSNNQIDCVFRRLHPWTTSTDRTHNMSATLKGSNINPTLTGSNNQIDCVFRGLHPRLLNPSPAGTRVHHAAGVRFNSRGQRPRIERTTCPRP